MYAAKLETGQSPTTRQMSGTDPEGNYILSVLTKRTYQISRKGGCVSSDEQVPLTIQVWPDPQNSDLLASDTDLFPYKPFTDVVVQGHARSMRAQRTFEAAVHLADHTKSLLAVGDRKCSFSFAGGILFSDPQPIEKVPLSYGRAYGGKDAFAEARYGNPYEALLPYLELDLSRATPYAYPRNPVGVGYLMEPDGEALERLELPNLEDPQDRLSPERLAVRKPGYWPLMPLPQSMGWIDHGWFPRLAYFGFIPQHEKVDVPIPEVVRGFAPETIMKAGPVIEKFSFRCANGASLGLQLPYLRGDEEVLFENIHPNESQFAFRLPGERPKIWTDGRNGRLNPTEPVLHTVFIEPDESRLSTVWCGSAVALRPYLPDELAGMPLRVEW